MPVHTFPCVARGARGAGLEGAWACHEGHPGTMQQVVRPRLCDLWVQHTRLRYTLRNVMCRSLRCAMRGHLGALKCDPHWHWAFAQLMFNLGILSRSVQLRCTTQEARAEQHANLVNAAIAFDRSTDVTTNQVILVFSSLRSTSSFQNSRVEAARDPLLAGNGE